MNRSRARALFDKGITTVEKLAESPIATILAIIAASDAWPVSLFKKSSPDSRAAAVEKVEKALARKLLKRAQQHCSRLQSMDLRKMLREGQKEQKEAARKGRE